MNDQRLRVAIEEARRFLARAEKLQRDVQADPRPGGYRSDFPIQNGSVRRASMDLTRALADLRRPS